MVDRFGGCLHFLSDAAVPFDQFEIRIPCLGDPFHLGIVALFHGVRPLFDLPNSRYDGRRGSDDSSDDATPHAAHAGACGGKAGCVGDGAADGGNHLAGFDVAIGHGIAKLRDEAPDAS